MSEDGHRRWRWPHPLDVAALVAGLAALGVVLGLYLRGPMRNWSLSRQTPRMQAVTVEVTPSPGYERLLPLLEGRTQVTRGGGARVLGVDLEAGTARLEIQAREEPGGRLSYGSRTLRMGTTLVFHDTEVYFLSIVTRIEHSP